MRALLALPPVRTEAREVESAQRLPHMLLAAPLPERAEPLVVMRAGRQSRGWIDVQVVAVFPADAVARPVVIGAFGSGANVVLV